MTDTSAFTLPHSHLNGFLFADVGVEASGMTLSVLSVLARVGMDPWQEAGRLATLPPTAAVDGLARMIAAMPASLWSLADATAIAARLVPLLPVGGRNHSASASVAVPGAAWTVRQWFVVVLLVASVVGLTLHLIAPKKTIWNDVATQWPTTQTVSPNIPRSAP